MLGLRKACGILGSRFGATSLSRRWEVVTACKVRQGMIIEHEGKYLEVTKFVNQKQGRGAATVRLDYVDLGSYKPNWIRMPSDSKVTKIDPTRFEAQVMYIDKDAGVLAVADDNFEQHEIPLKLAEGAENHLEAGTTIGIIMHENTYVKLALPNSIMQKLKK